MSSDDDLVAGPVERVGEDGADAAAADDDGLHAVSSGIGSRTTQTAQGAFFRTYGMVRPDGEVAAELRAIGEAQDEQVGVALDGLVDERRADVAGLEQDRLELDPGRLGRPLGEVEDLLDLLGAAGDVHVERHRPVDLDDVDADQLGLVGLASSATRRTSRCPFGGPTAR